MTIDGDTFQLHKEDCQYYKENTVADDSWGYMGQGDYHLVIRCELGKMELVPLPKNYKPGQKGCPKGCPYYQTSLPVEAKK